MVLCPMDAEELIGMEPPVSTWTEKVRVSKVCTPHGQGPRKGRGDLGLLVNRSSAKIYSVSIGWGRFCWVMGYFWTVASFFVARTSPVDQAMGMKTVGWSADV